jgi:hypothetical protein
VLDEWVGNGLTSWDPIVQFDLSRLFTLHCSRLHNYDVLPISVFYRYLYASYRVDSLVYFHASKIYMYSSLIADYSTRSRVRETIANSFQKLVVDNTNETWVRIIVSSLMRVIRILRLPRR